MLSREFEKTLTEVEARSKSNTKRLNDHVERFQTIENKIENVMELTTSVKLLTQQLGNTNDKLGETNVKIDKVSADVESIKMKPANKWEDMASKVIWALVGGVLAYVLSQLGLSA